MHPFPTDKRNIQARAAGFAGFVGLASVLAALTPTRPDVVLAYCQSRQIDEEGHEIAPDYRAWTADVSETKWCGDYVRPGVDEILDTLAIKNTIPNVSAVLMRKADLSMIEDRVLELRNAGDWLLYVHLLKQGRIAFVADVLNNHRRHSGSVTIGRGGLNLMREILMVQDIVHRHGDLFADLPEELHVRLVVGAFLLARKSHGPQSPERRRQRNDAQ